MFYEEINAFNMSARPQEYKQCVLVGTSECKYNLMCSQENSTECL